MRKVVAVLLAVFAIARDAHSQSAGETGAIQVAAARYAIAHFAKGRVAFDTSNALLRGANWHAVSRAAADVAAMSAALNGGVVGALSDFRVCADPTNSRSCHLEKADAVLSLGLPQVDGQNATIAVRVLQGYNLPERNRRWIGSRNERLQLTKQNGTWIVTGVLPGGSVS